LIAVAIEADVAVLTEVTDMVEPINQPPPTKPLREWDVPSVPIALVRTRNHRRLRRAGHRMKFQEGPSL
jgi:hypothetical protein